MAFPIFRCHFIIVLFLHFIRCSKTLPFPNEESKWSTGDNNNWFNMAQNQLKADLKDSVVNEKKAKNIIMFLGDGMSIATITAARIVNEQNGKEFIYDQLPFTGLSKTYCVDGQVADSACTATAYLRGIKGNLKTIGVTGDVQFKDCKGSLQPKNRVQSIAKWAQTAGMETGIVTTTRVTHATPAGVFGFTADRDWESDYDVRKDNLDPTECQDLASQLVLGDIGKNFKVILGGGRKKFLPNTTLDQDNLPGERQDGLDLTMIWKFMKASNGEKAAYVTNRDEMFEAIKTNDCLLGLFHNNHMEYHLFSDSKKHPRLAEMTSVAIDLLSSKKTGYFLFVEGGKIDQAHHDSYANMALDETIELADAIKMALEKSGDDTLIVITSDHAHTMSLSGNMEKGEDILESYNKGNDNLLYETILYSNGHGFKGLVNGSKFNTSPQDIHDPKHQFPGTIPLLKETHGGEDVSVFAKGPWSHIFTGSYEQNYIPHAMAFAACIGPGLTACSQT